MNKLPQNDENGKRISAAMAKSLRCVYAAVACKVVRILVILNRLIANNGNLNRTQLPSCSEFSCAEKPSIGLDDYIAIAIKIATRVYKRVSHTPAIVEAFGAKYRLTVGARHNLSIGDGI